ncbi:hypothetical protein K432DRAFT_236678 [Lepidopterella palustris CBS 459.81]|uniref:Uncharacterized protein n=1 Tax=Lepidopterella palustris CBS 459.81 TaxID=1314670 RepID=A0A8E2EDT1_9PEZI|nr:hypothetical protein K432DRAFT_236678 [Lepidopterella palustris CBS 459.81]
MSTSKSTISPPVQHEHNTTTAPSIPPPIPNNTPKPNQAILPNPASLSNSATSRSCHPASLHKCHQPKSLPSRPADPDSKPPGPPSAKIIACGRFNRSENHFLCTDLPGPQPKCLN